MAIAPAQNLLAKTMLTHIGLSLTIGTAAAAYFWTQKVVPAREHRVAYYQKYNLARNA